MDLYIAPEFFFKQSICLKGNLQDFYLFMFSACVQYFILTSHVFEHFMLISSCLQQHQRIFFLMHLGLMYRTCVNTKPFPPTWLFLKMMLYIPSDGSEWCGNIWHRRTPFLWQNISNWHIEEAFVNYFQMCPHFSVCALHLYGSSPTYRFWMNWLVCSFIKMSLSFKLISNC